MTLWVLTVDNDHEYECEIFTSEADAHAWFFAHWGRDAHLRMFGRENFDHNERWPNQADGFQALVEFHHDRSNDYGSFETNLTEKVITIDVELTPETTVSK